MKILRLSGWSLILASLTHLTVVSPSTPSALLPLLKSPLYSTVEVTSHLTPAPDIIVDVSFEGPTTVWLSSLCEEIQVPLLVLGPVLQAQSLVWTYYLGGTYAAMTSALQTVLTCLGLKDVTVVGDASSYSRALETALRQQESELRLHYNVFASEEPADTYVGKVLRPFGNRMTMFITSPRVTKKLLKAQYRMHIGGSGYANLMPLPSALYSVESSDREANLVEGELLVAEEGDSLVASETEFYATKYALVQNLLASDFRSAKSLLDLQFPSHSRSSTFIVLNLHNSTRTPAGRVQQGKCSFQAPLFFLGGSQSLPTNYTAPISVSANFGRTNPPGTSQMPIDSSTIGSIMAFEEVNERPDILPRFDIDLWNFTGGVTTFNSSIFAARIMPQREKFGAAIVTNIPSSNTVQLVSYLRKQGVVTPAVGASNTLDVLSSPTAFPNYIRLCLPDSFVNLVMAQTIKRLGWSSCSLLVVDTGLGLTARAAFQALLPQSGITILNDARLQVISSAVTSLEEARANFTEAFQHIIATKCRLVIVVSMQVSRFIPVVFYELGMRSGDLIIFGREWITAQVFSMLNETEAVHGLEVMAGSLQFSPDFLVGAVGQAFRTKYWARRGIPPEFYSCQYYDAAFTIAYALEWMLESGKDFMDADAMMKALRGVRFVGCTGRVYFDSTSNDRLSMRYGLDTLQPNGSSAYLQRIGLYDPTGMVLLTLNSSFVWGDGTTNLPGAFRDSTIGCPFEDRLSHNFEPGQSVLTGTGSGLVAFALLTGVVVYKRFRVPLVRLNEKSELEIEDALVMFESAVEFVQLLGLIGDFSFLSETLQRWLYLVIGNLAPLYSLTNGEFTHLWLVAELTIGFWIVALLLLNCLPKSVLGDDLSRVLMEISTHVFACCAFVPAVFILLRSFECTKGTANVDQQPSFTSSYLAADCYVDCWQGFHLLVTCLSAATLLVLVVIVSVYRPLWQISHASLHVHASVHFLQLRTVFQVLQVTLYRLTSSTLHAALVLGTHLGYFIVLVVGSTYGYARLRLSHLAGEAALLWAALMCLCKLVSTGDVVFQVLIWVGWLFILSGTVAFLFWKVPSLLYRPQGINTLHLYKFAFKPVTAQIASNLQLEFMKTQKRCTVRGAYAPTIQGNSESRLGSAPVESDGVLAL